MIKHDTCIRCGKQNLVKLTVNNIIRLQFPEKIDFRGCTQREISPTDAFVCEDCGHIEFVFDWEKV